MNKRKLVELDCCETLLPRKVFKPLNASYVNHAKIKRAAQLAMFKWTGKHCDNCGLCEEYWDDPHELINWSNTCCNDCNVSSTQKLIDFINE